MMLIGPVLLLIEDIRWVFVSGNLVIWKQKQSIVARSSAEAKYRALSQGIYEGMWIKMFLSELRVPIKKLWKLCVTNCLLYVMLRTPYTMIEPNVSIGSCFIIENIELGLLNLSYFHLTSYCLCIYQSISKINLKNSNSSWEL